MKDRGKSDDEIYRANTQTRRNQKMSRDTKNKDSKSFNRSIIWGADDVNLHSFDYVAGPDQQAIKITVAEYFWKRYGIKLRYPRMPLVSIGKREWFPVEFLFQAFGKMKGANSDSQKNAVLDYYNDTAGSKRVNTISNLTTRAFSQLQRYGLTVQDVLSQYNLRMSHEPVEVTAKVLPEPILKFANNNTASIQNGSWNLRSVKFET